MQSTRGHSPPAAKWQAFACSVIQKEAAIAGICGSYHVQCCSKQHESAALTGLLRRPRLPTVGPLLQGPPPVAQEAALCPSCAAAWPGVPAGCGLGPRQRHRSRCRCQCCWWHPYGLRTDAERLPVACWASPCQLCLPVWAERLQVRQAAPAPGPMGQGRWLAPAAEMPAAATPAAATPVRCASAACCAQVGRWGLRCWDCA